MTAYLKPVAVLLLAVSLGACTLNSREQRALTGGGVGAAGGALVGALSGGSALTGAVIGGAGGAAVGALTDEDDF